MRKTIITAISILVTANLICQNSSKMVTVYSTSENSNQRLMITDKVFFSDIQTDADVSIFVNPAKTFQSILGIGGALTDASAEVFAKLPANKQKE